MTGRAARPLGVREIWGESGIWLVPIFSSRLVVLLVGYSERGIQGSFMSASWRRVEEYVLSFRDFGVSWLFALPVPYLYRLSSILPLSLSSMSFSSWWSIAATLFPFIIQRICIPRSHPTPLFGSYKIIIIKQRPRRTDY